MRNASSIMQLEEMRIVVFEALRHFNNQSDATNNGPDMKIFNNLRKKTEELIASKYTNNHDRQDKRLNERERRNFLEVIHDLLIEGVIMWGNPFDRDTTTHPNFSITSYGQKVLEANEIIPHDPDNYLEHLKKTVPNIDQLALMYIEESVQCFLRSNQIACSVMLGVAAEAVFYQLFEWMKSYATNVNFKRNIGLVDKQISIKKKQDIIFGEIRHRKQQLDSFMREGIDRNLDGIGNLIRLQRNDSGHPTGSKKTRDEMFVNLRLFVPFCKQIYDLINWLDEKHKNNIDIF